MAVDSPSPAGVHPPARRRKEMKIRLLLVLRLGRFRIAVRIRF